MQTPSWGWGGGLGCPLPLWGILAPHSGTCPSPLCSACSPCLTEVTLSPLGSESPQGQGAARAEEAQALPVNSNDFCVALSTSSHADVSQVFQQTHFLAGMLADQQNLENIQGWAQLCCELGKRGCVALCDDEYLNTFNTFGWCLWNRGQAGRPVPHRP